MTQPVTPTFSVAAAAAACQVSRRTIARHLDQLKQAGAYKDAAGVWVIPLGALMAAGFTPGKPAAPDHAQDVTQGRHHPDNVGSDGRRVADLVAENADLRRRVEVAEAHRAAAEQVAAERERIIGVLEQSLRQLQSAPESGLRAPVTPERLVSQPNTPTATSDGLIGGVRRLIFGR